MSDAVPKDTKDVAADAKEPVSDVKAGKARAVDEEPKKDEEEEEYNEDEDEDFVRGRHSPSGRR